MNQEENELLTQHIHPMEIRLIGVEKDVEYLSINVNKLSQGVDDLKASVEENTEVVNKIWNSMWGGGIAVLIIWAIVKFIMPLVATV